ncbi:hypothetical protein [Arsukibacterium indicum]|uniref:Restriction endonuclease n=1 Tax=Arsukibacterium indicum TaxID=2848612 RepID=A0ABS6MHB3_9GAMM|nr:hypothetical protein [Arsukibacterium indicum]MBV2128206.1 hypothetical protein [Arsukibacterium indicum]
MTNTENCIKAYRKHKHLKNAADELGIKWQALYRVLVAANEPVMGDKERYGSESDKFARLGEAHFAELVPYAEDQNKTKFQSKCDFLVRGFKVDVKCARPAIKQATCKNKSWAFSVKKQRLVADFIVCIGYDEAGKPCFYLLIPGEIARNHGTISLSISRKGKWWDYEVSKEDIEPFFASLIEKETLSA